MMNYLTPHDLTYASSGFPVYNGRGELLRISLEELNRCRAIWAVMQESVTMAAQIYD